VTEVTLARELRGGDVVMTLVGEVDLANVGDVAIDLRHEVGQTARALVLDLREVTYLDSAGVRLLFDLADRLHGSERELVVVARPGSLLANVLRMVALDRVVVVAHEVDAGLALVDGRTGEDGGPPVA
jgi:anti-anti-sigma factor